MIKIIDYSKLFDQITNLDELNQIIIFQDLLFSILLAHAMELQIDNNDLLETIENSLIKLTKKGLM